MTATISTSQPARAVWIEIVNVWKKQDSMPSQPARAVWIEMQPLSHMLPAPHVTACEGCVD